MNNMSQIMKQAKVMQDKMAEMQKKIEEQEVEGSSGGGVVKVIINGKNEIKSLKIDPTLINSDEVEVLEDQLDSAGQKSPVQTVAACMAGRLVKTKPVILRLYQTCQHSPLYAPLAMLKRYKLVKQFQNAN